MEIRLEHRRSINAGGARDQERLYETKGIS